MTTEARLSFRTWVRGGSPETTARATAATGPIGKVLLALGKLPLAADELPDHHQAHSEAAPAAADTAAFDDRMQRRRQGIGQIVKRLSTARLLKKGWSASEVSDALWLHNGPAHAGFSLVRGWIENHTGIEIGTNEMRAQDERFFRELVAEGA